MGGPEILESIKSLGAFPGPVLAALMAGIISLAVTILAKDQKTSEFRQAWIDGLRADVAEFSGICAAMLSIVRLKKKSGDQYEKYLMERHDDFTKMEVLLNKILLRLNPKEHTKVILLLKKLVDGGMAAPNELEALLKELVESIQEILKKEWRRVKRGELSYVFLKWGSLSIAVSMLIWVCVSYLI